MEVDTPQPSEHGERSGERTEQQNIERLSKQLNALQQQLRTATLHTRRTARRISSMTRADMPRPVDDFLDGLADMSEVAAR